MMPAILIRSLLFQCLLRSVTPVRIDDSQAIDVSEEQLSQENKVQAYEKAVEKGAEIAANMTCDELVVHMKSELENAERVLSELFADPATEEAVVLSSDRTMAFAHEADKRKCLPKVMHGAQAQVETLLQNHLNKTLLSSDLKPEWCHNGVLGLPLEYLKNHPDGTAPCCHKDCEGCAKRQVDSFECDWCHKNVVDRLQSKTPIDNETRECLNRTGGETLTRYCDDREDTACLRRGIEENPAVLLEKAYGQLLAWQQGTYDRAQPEYDRTFIFPEDIEDEENCPEPCGMCTKSHNSWRKGEENFKFKCLLQPGQSPPSDSRLECSVPKRRRSFWRWHRWGRKSWCEVKSWKQSACIELKMSALAACGAKAIVSTFTEQPWRFGYTSCLDEEMRLDQYKVRGWDNKLTMHVPRQNYVAFNLVLSLGLINGLAALRDESKNPSALPASSLLEPFLQGRTADVTLQAVFNRTSNSELSCATDFLEECEPQWKAKMLEWPVKVKVFVSEFLIKGFWTTFWGGLTLFGNTLLLAAIGWATGAAFSGALGVLAVGYLVVVTGFFGVAGFLTSEYHCNVIGRGRGLYDKWTPTLCRWMEGKTECDRKYGYRRYKREKGESWTDLIEEARKGSF